MSESHSAYMRLLTELDETIEHLEETILNVKTSPEATHVARVRRKQLVEVRKLASGQEDSLPRS